MDVFGLHEYHMIYTCMYKVDRLTGPRITLPFNNRGNCISTITRNKIVHVIMSSSITNSNLFLFADDAKCFRNVDSYSEQQLLQHDINSLLVWSTEWELYFNQDKCVHMVNLIIPCIFHYYLEDIIINQVEVQRDLGLMHDFGWSGHVIANLSQPRPTECWNFYGAGLPYLNVSVKLNLYTAVVCS